MKLSEALTKLKNLKSQVTRVEAYIRDSIIYDEDEPPKYEYMEELKKRKELQLEIDELKENIQRTNATTVIEYDSVNTLAGLILKNANMRCNLSFYQSIQNVKAEYHSSFTDRTKDTIKKLYAKGYDKKAIRKLVDQLEQEKEKVEALINYINMNTDLVGE